MLLNIEFNKTHYQHSILLRLYSYAKLLIKQNLSYGQYYFLTVIFVVITIS
jgi:hypothetical protein